ncbi:parB-like partition protein (plasmid) [Deinococcus geothermalis DSM 11300]|uniref:ParB-like partition protein n=1 Tax=Deinococcus geothermalis (strain DSM 11300 / CIP 105573 / AG-3a) TaxID=319795 RepID=A8ZRC6_DEIGD|nr:MULTISPECIES: ParB/RepB/Spo0J family partition protein [Deinococcus]ABW35035.1 parB-like partition protein [Deinococcus geothermalis DSM 11300]TDE84815.1 ParB/RepB/Spo0J family partition protein [Deinococcus sp. S9]
MDQSPPPTLFAQPLATAPQTVALADIKPGEASQLIKSVGTVGVLQSLLLKPSSDPAYRFEIVEGNRRDHSARHYGLTHVPALITDGSGAQLAAARAIANTARSSNPVQEARAWHAVLQEGVYADVNALARDFGVNVATVKQRLRLMRLPDQVLDGIQGRKIAEGTAEKIANLDEAYRTRALVMYSEVTARGERFTDAHLKEIRTRRGNDLTRTVLGALSTLPSAQPLLSLPPAQVLAEEVRRLARDRGVELAELIAALGGTASPPVPVVSASPAPSVKAAPFMEVPVPAAPSVPPVSGRVRLGVRR